MTWKEMLSRFCCGAAVVVIAHLLFVNVDAQEAGDAVDVCINGEGVMRLIDANGACGGDRKVRLKHPPVEKPCETSNAAEIDAMQRRIAELEGRSDERLLDRTAMAPFEVVNEAGIVVFSVTPPNQGDALATTEFFNETGARIAHIAANIEGGAVGVQSGVQRQYTAGGGAMNVPAVSAMLSTMGERSGMSVYTQSTTRLELGRRPNGNYAFSVFGQGEKLVAGIGESLIGTGIATVFDTAGLPRAMVNVASVNGAGQARIFDASEKAIASLAGNGEGGSGLLQLRNNGDVVMVEAGMLNTGIGVVRAGPGAFQHGIGFVGLPASYIEGTK